MQKGYEPEYPQYVQLNNGVRNINNWQEPFSEIGEMAGIAETTELECAG
jgi:hypothetical protein